LLEPTEHFDSDSVRASWDAAADAYAEGQAAGRDYYRYEFFGPQHVSLCGDVEGLSVLDLGCGSGYFAREMALAGASVTAVDISPRMLEHARRIEADTPLGITYLESDAASIGRFVPEGRFDLVTSCMALQDMPGVPGVLQEAHRALRDGGRLVVSIAHPCTDTPFRKWERDDSGGKRWLCIDRYFERGPLEYPWRGWAYEFSTSAIHATLEDWFGWFLSAGFSLSTLREPRPSEAALANRPDLEDASRVPYYLLLDFTASRAPRIQAS